MSLSSHAKPGFFAQPLWLKGRHVTRLWPVGPNGCSVEGLGECPPSPSPTAFGGRQVKGHGGAECMN